MDQKVGVSIPVDNTKNKVKTLKREKKTHDICSQRSPQSHKGKGSSTELTFRNLEVTSAAVSSNF